MKILNSSFCKLAGALALALSSSAALASHVPPFGFTGEDFIVNPAAVGEAACVGDCVAKFIDFSYQAEVDQIKTGATSASFTETGGGFFTGFLKSLSQPELSGTGLGAVGGYNLYVLFSGAGNTGPGGPGEVDGSFTSFTYTIYVDRDQDTTIAPDPRATPGLPGESITAVDATPLDDIAVLTGSLIPGFGGFHIDLGDADGDFAVLASATRLNCDVFGPGCFFEGDAFADGNTRTDINGNNESILGIPSPDPFANAIDISITGSGAAAFQAVPEPGSLTLLGLALAGLAVSRRSKKA